MALTRITKGVIKPNENYDTHNIVSTGIVTSVGLDVNGNADISGSLSIGGVLTYEDVTSIDSIGIITARSGIDADDFISVGSNIHLGNAGVITATSFVGDGSGLIGVASTDNIITGTAATFNTYPVDINAGMDVAGVTTFSSNVNLLDNNQLRIGTGADLRLYHDPSANISWITNTGNLFIIKAQTTAIQDAGGKNQIITRANGEVELNYNGVLKLETASSGISVVGTTTSTQLAVTGVSTFTGAIDLNADLDVDGHTNLDNVSVAGVSTFTGTLNSTGGIILTGNMSVASDTAKVFFGASNDLSIFHDGNHSYIDDTGTGNLYIQSNHVNIDSKNGEQFINCIQDGAVELYHNNQKKLETKGYGIDITGGFITTGGSIVNDGGNIKFGTGSDLQIFHDNSNNINVIQCHNGRTLHIDKDNGAENMAKFIPDGAVELYHNNSKQFETSAKGIQVGTGVTIETNGQATFTGIVTASTYYGDGSNLSNITSTTINSNTNNYLITGTGTANTLQGESNLTFDGSTLTIDGDQKFQGASGYIIWDKSVDRLIFRNNMKAAFGNSSQLEIRHDGSSAGYIRQVADGYLRIDGNDGLHFYTTPSGGSTTERLRIGSAGQIGIAGANYGTSGQVLTSQGSGSAVAWTTISGTTINNNADNRVITGSGTANTLNGEANFTYDGTYLAYSAVVDQTYSSSTNTNYMMAFTNNNGIRHLIRGDGIFIGNNMNTSNQSSGPNNKRIELKTNGEITTTGNITATGYVDSGSDIKLKTNIKTIDNALDKVLQLRGAEYDRIDRDNQHEIGVIAQEVEKIIPEVVHGDETKTVSYGNLVGLLIEAVKDLKKEIDELKSS